MLQLDTKALIFACEIDGTGGAHFLQPDAFDQVWQKNKGLLWAHLNLTQQKAQEWLVQKSHIHPILTEVLLAEHIRPTVRIEDHGLLLIVKGINYDKGAAPEDMTSLRIWATHNRIITLRAERTLSVEDLKQKLLNKNGIKNTGDFLVEVLDRIVIRMHDSMEDLEEELDTLEEMNLKGANPLSRTRLATLRQQTVGLRKHLHPQRDTMVSLPRLKISWINPSQNLELTNIAEKQTRYVEELDYIRERSLILQEQLNGYASENIVKKMYLLTVLTFLFDPLSLIVGLFGANVGGIPGGEDRGGFLGLLSGLIATTFLIIYIMKKRRLF
jgi:zinc transporter